MAQLSIKNLKKHFGALQIIQGFDLEVDAGARHAIVGPNGAGKTTLFNMISGWLKPTSGSISLDRRDLAGLTPEQVNRAGLARSFQKNALFEGLTVFENLRLAVQAGTPNRFNLIRSASSFSAMRTKAEEVAVRMRLGDALDREVKTLSYGQKRQLEVGIALACSPKALLLDEPAAGTSPAERLLLIDTLRALPKDITLVLVEHDMDVVFGVCEQVTVLNYGVAVATGSPDQIRQNPEVRAAYLGESASYHGANL
ncbi:ABC transporter ATP-binding protein [Sinorhizobium fredii]|uniref:ABC transporter ATP-binding protein n=1 Tax=Rhizobium fredii TaxID=380 RepID=UPI0004BC327F|nr:ABC transporter ATP-binding protein [Sinorhizobium fredii]